MKKFYSILLITLMLFLVACNSGGEAGKTTTAAKDKSLLSAADFNAKLDELSNEFLIDLRTHGELHQIGPIKGARNIDFNAGRFEQIIPRLPKEQPIMLYCKSGGRSGKATQMLKDAGFTEVYDLDGGITAWKEAGLQVEAHHHHHH